MSFQFLTFKKQIEVLTMTCQNNKYLPNLPPEVWDIVLSYIDPIYISPIKTVCRINFKNDSIETIKEKVKKIEQYHSQNIWSHCGNYILCLFTINNIRIIDINTNNVIQTFTISSDDNILSVNLNNIGTQLITNYNNKFVRLWNISSGICLKEFYYNDILKSVIFDPTNTELISCDINNHIYSRNIITDEYNILYKSDPTENSNIVTFAISNNYNNNYNNNNNNNNNNIIAIYSNSNIKILNKSNNMIKMIDIIEIEIQDIINIVFSPNDRYIAYYNLYILQIYDLNKKSIIKTVNNINCTNFNSINSINYNDYINSISSVAFYSDNTNFLIKCKENQIYKYNIYGGVSNYHTKV